LEGGSRMQDWLHEGMPFLKILEVKF